MLTNRTQLDKTRPVTKAEFRTFTQPKPSPHHSFMASLGFSLRQTIGGVSVYSYTGSKETQTPMSRSVLLIVPLWVTIVTDDMIIQHGGTTDKPEPFSETRIVQMVLDTRQTRREWKFPALPEKYQGGEDEYIFVSGIDWDGDPEDDQPDPDVIPF